MSADLHQLGDPAIHFWLTRSVARVMGVNLSEAMADYTLSAANYAEMVNRCRRCPHVTNCYAWLGEAHDRPAQAPPHCCIGDTIQGLSKREMA